MNEDIITLLTVEKDLGGALMRLKSFLDSSSLPEFEGRYEEIASNYALMKEFMLKGYSDPQRNDVYFSLLQKCYRLYADGMMTLKKRKNSGLSYSSVFADGELSADIVRSRLEAFVQDVAFLSLEGNNKEAQAKIYREHHELMTSLFYQLMMGHQWSVKTREAYQELLLSPTIDSVDAQLLVSAVMLSLLQVFDTNKFLMLLHVYGRSLDENIRQRALVGWALTLPHGEELLFHEIKEEVNELLQAEQVKQDLLELQIQMVYCMDAEKDTAEIQQEIMPNLMKGHNLNIITETGEDPLQDILHPESSEQAMENLEKSYHRMQEMQKKGSDIYFGGFSQMKRFPFFQRINNWFCPFYPAHPELTPIAGMEGSSFINNLFETGPFCHSDKYSFALAMSTVIQQIPANVREMMGSDAVFANAESQEEQKKPAYLRRMYLQDMYRFFRVAHIRHCFNDPFTLDVHVSRGFFLMNGLIKVEDMTGQLKELGRFFLRRKKYDWMKKLFALLPLAEDVEVYNLQAITALHNKDYFKAQVLYEKILKQAPHDVSALKGLAQASFYVDDFDVAERCYEELYELLPTDKNIALNLCISRIRNEHIDEGVALLFKLEYEYPHDLSVLRALAWGQMMLNHLAEAEVIFQKIMNGAINIVPNDYLHTAYCQWLLSKITDAVESFKTFVRRSNIGNKSVATFLKECWLNDDELLKRHGLSDIDRNVMADLVVE